MSYICLSNKTTTHHHTPGLPKNFPITIIYDYESPTSLGNYAKQLVTYWDPCKEVSHRLNICTK